MQQQYLIQFYATVKGHQLVVKNLSQIERQLGRSGKSVKQFTVTQKGLEKSTVGLAGKMGKLALRAVMVVPIWMALRAAMMRVLMTIRMIVTGLLDLDEGMARIKTVMHGTAESIARDMGSIRAYILQMATRSRVPIKELTEAFYFLKTANLSAQEAMAAFIPTLNAMVGTGNKAKNTARAVAGMYNTMGKYLGDTLTITEKFTKIADVLTYTYATQDVQLEELIAGYTKLAPYLSGLDDDFETIVATLGFLNTQLLRGGRTGRLKIGRAHV